MLPGPPFLIGTTLESANVFFQQLSSTYCMEVSWAYWMECEMRLGKYSRKRL
jgi:hypothetical protein